MHSATKPDNQFTINGFNPITNASLHSDWAFGVDWLIKKNRLKLGLHYVDGKQRFINAKGISDVGTFRYINPSIQWMMKFVIFFY